MLHITDLIYRIEGRTLFDGATVAINEGWKVGLVGPNGAGKTTLLRLIRGEIHPESGDLALQKGRRLGWVEQEAPAGDDALIDVVLAADAERARLLAELPDASEATRIADIQTRLADIGAHAAPARAARILAGLGFTEDAQKRPCKDFSGGWRMRVALAAVLFAEPDLLLLDEPTNYLDLEGAVWLESYLRAYRGAVLIVSHDRRLLNNSVNRIVRLAEGKLTLFTGGYDAVERAVEEHQARQLSLKAKQEDQKRQLQAFVDRFRYKASKAKQAQSRLRVLEKMQPIATLATAQTHQFHFPEPKPMAPPIIRFADAALGYDQDNPVLRDVALRIDPGDRIALLGPNGEGKSTFAKVVAGKLTTLAGSLYRHKKLKIGYFAQHQIDELKPDQSACDHVRALAPDATEREVRSKAAAIGFGAEKADTKAANLSGGEKARLLLGLITFDAPHVLILDEPTNHLDVDSRESLIRALADYSGAVILISHDSHFVESCADRLLVINNGAVTPFDGDLNDYRQLILTRDKTPSDKSGGPARAQNGSRKATRREAAQRRQSLRPLKRRIEKAETDADSAKQEIARLDVELAQPGLFDREPDRAAALAKQRRVCEEAIDRAENDWLEASAAYENAQANAES